MTVDPRLERQLPDILDSLYLSGMPAYRDDLIQQVRRTSQRPAWSFLERWIPMADIASRPAFAPRLPSRALGMALIILALVIALAVAFIGTRPTRLPAPFGPAANGSIAYEVGGDIYVGDPVTGQTRLVVGGSEVDAGPGYSPDGTLIAFTRVVDASRYDLYAVRPDGSDLRRLTPTPIPNDTWANWAPDSRNIATIRAVETTGCGKATCVVGQLELVDATGSGAVQRVAEVPGMDFVAFRPPAGNEILYRAVVDGKFGLFAMNADGSDVRTIAEPTIPEEVGLAFANAVYTSDGTRIFYQHSDGRECCSLWVMNADGTDPHEFRPLGRGWDGLPAPSPDGIWVAYQHGANDEPAHGLTVVRADGTGPVTYTGPILSGPAHWAWAPDSSKILLSPNDGGGTVYLLDPEGGPFTTVTWKSGDSDWQRVAPPG